MFDTASFVMQAIFQLIPALTGMMEEELVGVEQFVAPLWARPHPPIALYCRNERLLKAFESLGSSDEGSDNIEKFRVDEVEHLPCHVILSSDSNQQVLMCRRRSLRGAVRLRWKESCSLTCPPLSVCQTRSGKEAS